MAGVQVSAALVVLALALMAGAGTASGGAMVAAELDDSFFENSETSDSPSDAVSRHAQNRARSFAGRLAAKLGTLQSQNAAFKEAPRKLSKFEMDHPLPRYKPSGDLTADLDNLKIVKETPGGLGEELESKLRNLHELSRHATASASQAVLLQEQAEEEPEQDTLAKHLAAIKEEESLMEQAEQAEQEQDATRHDKMLSKLHKLQNDAKARAEKKSHSLVGALERLKALKARLPPKQKQPQAPATPALMEDEAPHSFMASSQRQETLKPDLRGMSLLGKVRAYATQAKMQAATGTQSSSVASNDFRDRLTARLAELEARTSERAFVPARVSRKADYQPVALLAQPRDDMMSKVANMQNTRMGNPVDQLDSAIQNQLARLDRANQLKRKQLYDEAVQAVAAASEGTETENPIIRAARVGHSGLHPLRDMLQRQETPVNSEQARAHAELAAARARAQQSAAVSQKIENARRIKLMQAAEAAAKEQEMMFSEEKQREFEAEQQAEISRQNMEQARQDFSNIPGLSSWTSLAETGDERSTSADQLASGQDQDLRIEDLLARARAGPVDYAPPRARRTARSTSLAEHLRSLKHATEPVDYQEQMARKLGSLRQQMRSKRAALAASPRFVEVSSESERQAPDDFAWPAPLADGSSLDNGQLEDPSEGYGYQLPSDANAGLAASGGLRPVPYSRYYDNIVTPYQLWQNPALESTNTQRYSDGTRRPTDMSQYDSWAPPEAA